MCARFVYVIAVYLCGNYIRFFLQYRIYDSIVINYLKAALESFVAEFFYGICILAFREGITPAIVNHFIARAVKYPNFRIIGGHADFCAVAVDVAVIVNIIYLDRIVVRKLVIGKTHRGSSAVYIVHPAAVADIALAGKSDALIGSDGVKVV